MSWKCFIHHNWIHGRTLKHNEFNLPILIKEVCSRCNKTQIIKKEWKVINKTTFKIEVIK